MSVGQVKAKGYKKGQLDWRLSASGGCRLGRPMPAAREQGD